MAEITLDLSVVDLLSKFPVTPHYTSYRWDTSLLLFEGCCEDVMRSIPDNYFDAIITDPPYGVAQPNSIRKVLKNSLAPFNPEWDRVTEDFGWVDQVSRVLRPKGNFLSFVSAFGVSQLVGAMNYAGIKPMRVVVWEKTNIAPNPRPNYNSATEFAVFGRQTAHKAARGDYKTTWNGGATRGNIYKSPICTSSKERTKHESQKPEFLGRQIIRDLTNPGDRIFDPFSGSGAFLISAVKEGRQAVGVEKREDFFQMACTHIKERLNTHNGN